MSDTSQLDIGDIEDDEFEGDQESIEPKEEIQISKVEKGHS